MARLNLPKPLLLKTEKKTKKKKTNMDQYIYIYIYYRKITYKFEQTQVVYSKWIHITHISWIYNIKKKSLILKNLSVIPWLFFLNRRRNRAWLLHRPTRLWHSFLGVPYYKIMKHFSVSNLNWGGRGELKQCWALHPRF